MSSFSRTFLLVTIVLLAAITQVHTQPEATPNPEDGPDLGAAATVTEDAGKEQQGPQPSVSRRGIRHQTTQDQHGGDSQTSSLGAAGDVEFADTASHNVGDPQDVEQQSPNEVQSQPVFTPSPEDGPELAAATVTGDAGKQQQAPQPSINRRVRQRTTQDPHGGEDSQTSPLGAAGDVEVHGTADTPNHNIGDPQEVEQQSPNQAVAGSGEAVVHFDSSEGDTGSHSQGAEGGQSLPASQAQAVAGSGESVVHFDSSDGDTGSHSQGAEGGQSLPASQVQCQNESARIDSYLDVPLVVRPFGSNQAYGSVAVAGSGEAVVHFDSSDGDTGSHSQGAEGGQSLPASQAQTQDQDHLLDTASGGLALHIRGDEELDTEPEQVLYLRDESLHNRDQAYVLPSCENDLMSNIYLSSRFRLQPSQGHSDSYEECEVDLARQRRRREENQRRLWVTAFSTIFLLLHGPYCHDNTFCRQPSFNLSQWITFMAMLHFLNFLINWLSK